MMFLVASLIGGIEVLAPPLEADDVECAPTLDVVLVEPRVLRDDNVVRVVRRKPVAELPTSTFIPVATLPAESQVLSLLRGGGRQRTVHPTGPPLVAA
ncbi:MAG TPA: hypothetical protein VL966_09355 [Alphaproteobacteria bacterium]|nr:hypothetical protein [Alphaproteobacteria bacterium]